MVNAVRFVVVASVSVTPFLDTFATVALCHFKVVRGHTLFDEKFAMRSAESVPSVLNRVVASFITPLV